MIIQKAKRSAVKIKLALTGVPGSGKTMSSLMLAKGMCPNGKIIVIDSEDGSSNLYADSKKTPGIEYDVLELSAPYTIDKYLKALDMALEAKYDVIIMDSISHAWAGEGGLLEKKSAIDARGGNSYTNWSSITKEHEKFKAKILHADAFIIVTMRSKIDYAMGVNEKGKQAPIKVGLAPIQRDDVQYDFTTVFDIAMDHSFTVSKDRTDLFDGRIEKISVKTGEEIRQWLEGGAPLKPKTNIDDEVKVLVASFMDGDDKAALEQWLELSDEHKKSVWKLLAKQQQDWLKKLMDEHKAKVVPVAQSEASLQNHIANITASKQDNANYGFVG